MGLLTCPVVLVLSVLSLQAFAYINPGEKESGKTEVSPMVAFICNKPTMHMTKEGWKKDESTDCLTEPWEILVYCKKMYPGLDITNIVESSEEVTIDNWCRRGHERCHHHGSHKVRPYRCLEGPFQSDALLVPEHCVFDHIHRSSECKSFAEWNKTAIESCDSRGMTQQSFAILLPCKVDRFSGVEFVCCPKVKENNSVPKKDPNDVPADNTSSEEDEDYSEEDEDDEDYLDEEWDEDEDDEEEDEDWIDDEEDWEDEDSQEDSKKDEASFEEEKSEEISVSRESIMEDEEDDDSFFSSEQKHQYLSKDVPKKHNKHGKHTQEKVKEVEVKVLPTEHLPEKDMVVMPTDAYTEYLRKPSEFVNEHQYFLKAKTDLQKHHHEKVTKMMKEWAAARQRVQEMKATDPKAADKLNKEITTRFQKTYQALEQEGMAEKQQIVALHQQRVQAELNDKKRHAMEHFMAALQDNQPDAAQILKALQHYIKAEQKDRMHTLNHYEHLRDTDPREARRVRQGTLDHLAIIDQRIHQAVEMLNRVPQFAKKIKLQIADFLKTFQEIDSSISSLLVKPADNEDEAKVKVEDTVVPVEEVPENEKVFEEKKEEQKEEEKIEKVQEIHHIPLYKNSQADQLDIASFDDETQEDEHYKMEVMKSHVAHSRVSEIGAEENYVQKQPMRQPTAPLPAMGIAIGSIAVFVIIVVGIVVLRKRAQRVPVNHGFVEVDQAVSPEERHVANMQMNGYENPTYKYFEMNGNA